MAIEAPTVVGLGAASVDVYRPVGEVGLNYVPGEGRGWSPEDEALLEALDLNACEVQLGGNVVNALSYLATQDFTEVRYAGVMGTQDAASKLISNSLPRAGISVDRSIFIDGYNSAVSIRECLSESSPMSRNKPGDPVEPYMDADYIKKISEDAGVVIVGSFYGDDRVGERVFGSIPEAAFVTFIPGYREYRQYPERLRMLMLNRNPTLLSLNEAELRTLYRDAESDTITLAAQASKLATYVLCTLGENGALLVHNGEVVVGEAWYIDPASIVDTTGAGDRAAAIATNGLLHNDSPEDILEDIAQGTLSVIRHLGATSDLYYSMDNVVLD